MRLPAAKFVGIVSIVLAWIILPTANSIAAEKNTTADSKASAPVDESQKSTDSEQSDSTDENSATPADDAQASDAPLGRDGKPLTPELIELSAKVRKTLALYESKHLNARDHTCWEVMHGLIAFGPRTQIYRDGPGGQTVNAMGWLCWGARCQGSPLLILENDMPHALYGVGLQGHDGQYLAMLAQWRVRPESPMQIGGKNLTIADYIEEEKLTCRSGTELTFKLIALSHYLPSDAKWSSRYGEQWNIPKLLKAEIEAPIHGAACGGTHRLFGISNAYKVRVKRGEPLTGEWARAHKYISDYHRYTLNSLQNPDGSFSTEWFNYAADRSYDLDRKLQTTGHILEWLAWSVPDEQLRDPKVMKAVNFLSGILQDNPDRTWSIGPWGHALHALMIYHERMFTEAPLPAEQIAGGQPLKTAARPTALESSIASAANPPEPSCEHCIDSLPAAKLKAAVESPAPISTADNQDKPAAAPTVDKTASAAKKSAADKSDGCTDSIPHESLRTAQRPAKPAVAPPPAATSAAPPTSTTQPRQAPFDRPNTTVIGP